MGVPAFFRYISQKYPKIISQVIEEADTELSDGTIIPVDISRPNPLGDEIDNLYLDMNGIVHPCSHPEDGPPPETEAEMMIDIFKYTNRLIKMVRPRKLLMIAVDGVAPRAKMNQQRSRRFRSARETVEAAAELESIAQRLREEEGLNIPESLYKKQTWDRNAITPGTPFMDILASALRFWVNYKLNKDPAWKDLKVIISDASVKGEGEHKIMNFIRSQRSQPHYNPNLRHVIYGLDADLIMLGLATHEPHVRILREDVFFQTRGKKVARKTKEEELRELALPQSQNSDSNSVIKPPKPFIWLHVSVLREYLAAELYVSGLSFPFNLEKAIDDFVFFSFFIGNDFLPHLPSLEIREGAIDLLTEIWKKTLPSMNGYVTDAGEINLKRVQLILQNLSKREKDIFIQRKKCEDRMEANQNYQKNTSSPAQKLPIQTEAKPAPTHDTETTEKPNSSSGVKRKSKNAPPSPPSDLLPSNYAKRHKNESVSINKDLVRNRAVYRLGSGATSSALVEEKANDSVNDEEVSAVSKGASGSEKEASRLEQETSEPEQKQEENEQKGEQNNETDELEEEDDDEDEDDEEELDSGDVRLWEPGYQDRYYKSKFKISADDIEAREKIVSSYVEGLAWVLRYYYHGCPSWTWYYPYHYAPFAEDFKNVDNISIAFDKGTAFRPFEQLLSVLPASSKQFLPEPFQKLMTAKDSDIIDFYPDDFEIDLNGKKMAWQGVALLPFINEERLLKAASSVFDLLDETERKRNRDGNDILFFSGNHALHSILLKQLYMKHGKETWIKLPYHSDGLFGSVMKDSDCIPHSRIYFPFDSVKEKWDDIDSDTSLSVLYKMPEIDPKQISCLLPGVKLPTPILNRNDIIKITERTYNMNFSNRPHYQKDHNRRQYGNGPNSYANNNHSRQQERPNHGSYDYNSQNSRPNNYHSNTQQPNLMTLISGSNNYFQNAHTAQWQQYYQQQRGFSDNNYYNSNYSNNYNSPYHNNYHNNNYNSNNYNNNNYNSNNYNNNNYNSNNYNYNYNNSYHGYNNGNYQNHSRNDTSYSRQSGTNRGYPPNTHQSQHPYK